MNNILAIAGSPIWVGQELASCPGVGARTPTPAPSRWHRPALSLPNGFSTCEGRGRGRHRKGEELVLSEAEWMSLPLRVAPNLSSRNHE